MLSVNPWFHAYADCNILGENTNKLLNASEASGVIVYITQYYEYSQVSSSERRAKSWYKTSNLSFEEIAKLKYMETVFSAIVCRVIYFLVSYPKASKLKLAKL
jgi:MFS superfamily sulfate permease-like transporter